MGKSCYHWPALIAGYFVLQIISRTFVGHGLGLDEAEMVLTAKNLAWGYGPQPPLYSWVQHGVFALVGTNIFALSLVKNSFLCLTYLFLYYSLRHDYDELTAGLASVSLLLLPQISWESQRALTHSVLSTMMIMVTFAIFLRLVRRQDITSYLLFGVAVACGTLSKFNYLIFPVALLIAAASLSQIRQLVFSRRILLSFASAGALLLFPLGWMVRHQDKVLESAHKFKVVQDGSRLQAAFAGMLDLTTTGFVFLGLLLVVFAVLFWLYREKSATVREPPLVLQLMTRTVVAALVLTFLIVLVSGTTNVKDRWLQPVLVLAAPTCTLWLLPHLSTVARRRLCQIFFVVALLIVVALPVHDLHRGSKKPSRRSAPFTALATAIKSRYPQVDVIYAQNKWIGGNLLYINRNWRVLIPGSILPEQLRGPVVAVWTSKLPHIPEMMLEKIRAQHRDPVIIKSVNVLQIPYPRKPEVTLDAGLALMEFK